MAEPEPQLASGKKGVSDVSSSKDDENESNETLSETSSHIQGSVSPNIEEIFEFEIIPTNFEKVFNLLLENNLAAHFQKFVDEDYDDKALAAVDPHGNSFWNTVAKVLPKSGTQIKFQNAIIKYREPFDSDGAVGLSVIIPPSKSVRDKNVKERNTDQDDEIPFNYNPFNIYEVSVFHFRNKES
ncbi:hypothetical protein ACFFRR_009655 [Megaselia abdita]